MNNYESVFISDLHLGIKDCKAEELLSFLQSFTCNKLYIVGDGIDFWALHKRVFWPPVYDKIIACIFDKMKFGCQVFWILGNHEDIMREHIPITLGNLKILDSTIHQCLNGKRLLVIHGDCFDNVIQQTPWLAHIGDRLYDLTMFVNRNINSLRKKMGYEYWPLSHHVKLRVKAVVSFISDFECHIVKKAHEIGAEGIVCGHIHHGENKMIEDVHYLNCGDFVDSCSYIVEKLDGTISLEYWRKNEYS